MKLWSGRSGPAKVDLYTRGSVYAIHWGAVLCVVLLMAALLVRDAGQPLLASAALLFAVVNGVLCHRLARAAIEAYLGRRAYPGRLLALCAATTAALAAPVVAAAKAVPEGLLPLLLGCCLAPLSGGHCLLPRARTVALHQVLALVVLAAVLPGAGYGAGAAVAVAVTVGLVTGWLAVTVRVSLWVLAVMWKLHAARDVEARLAVAEERLRFGRDLHDVLGRNLAVIALKSELAVELAHRGRPEAADQMTEVQRIARESQREVREVVRGYRDADLRAELDGASSVLAAAGIGCTVLTAPHPGAVPRAHRGGRELSALDAAVQSALGWVVREATTNTLRHGDARHCTISVGLSEGSAVLTVENDGAGARAAPAGPGSGLAGLRERLAAVGGSLEAGPLDGDRFRVAARVPLPEPEDPGAEGAGTAAPGAASGPVPRPPGPRRAPGKRRSAPGREPPRTSTEPKEPA
ncbi:histidine kinase [Streptomyces sp. C10-9-1]|uniref:sensor histidine kinase n=1 Tax=Streptomyces sp. C10-9-1 TaxID=1859285 RepID=UPI00211231EF|nr:histidine kinase [Streptomyces sp. C10-9-1]MCQ6555998.1 histidine kinase [Streptomyces sp. C10-9-1]